MSAKISVVKRKIIFTIIALVLLFIAAIIFTVVTAFKVIKPTTDAINRDIVRDIAKTIEVPKGIAFPAQDFYQTTYTWQMITPQKEVTPVIFTYTPAFLKNTGKIVATLSMPENGDPSVFGKVLEGIIVDKKSLQSAKYPQEANLEASPQAGYSKIHLSVTPKTSQTTSISWEFEKKNLSSDLNIQYKKLNSYPSFVLKFLYSLHGFVIDLFKGN